MPKIFYKLLFYFLLTAIPINSWAYFPNCALAKDAWNKAFINVIGAYGIVGDNVIDYDCPGAEPNGECKGLRRGYILAVKDQYPDRPVSQICKAKRDAGDAHKYGNYRSDDTVDPPKNAGGSCQNQVGNPINAGTGNKYQVETDYIGAGVFPLTLKRTYNSVLAQYWDSTVFKLPTAWTKVWASNYHLKLEYDKNSADLPTVMAYRADGKILNFYQSNAGIFKPDTDINDKVVQLVDTNGVLTGWKYTVASSGVVENYDATGKLKSLTNRNGAVQTLTYTATGLLNKVTDPSGRTLTFAYNSANRISQMTTPDGLKYLYTYDTNNNLIKITYPDSKFKTYHYENTSFIHHLTGITDERGIQFATFAYDTTGNAISSEHAGGVEKVSLVYNADGSTTVTDALNNNKTYKFQIIQGIAKNTELSQSCMSCGGSSAQKLTYDDNGNVKSRIDFKGNRTNYTYDTTRNLETQRIEGLAEDGSTTVLTRTISTQWHATLRLPRKVAEPRKLTTYTFSEDGLNCGPVGSICRKTVQETTDTTGAVGLNVTASGGRVWLYTYNPLGQLLTVDGPRTDVTDKTTYTYYSDTTTTHRVYDLWKITNALGHVTTISNYNANGRPLTSVDANGVTTQYAYNNRGWLSKTVVASTKTTTYTYNALGKLQTLTLPDGRTYTYGYDNAQRLVSITSGSGEKVTYTLDSLGNKTEEKITNSSGVVEKRLTQEFDALGNIAKSIESVQGVNAATTYTYDDMGNLSTETNPSGNVKTYTYDALSRLATAQEVLNGRNIINSYGYDTTNQQTSALAPNNAKTQYTYNGFGEVLTETSPDRGLVTYTYDSAGNVKTRKDARNKTLTYTYDALNRVLTSTDGTNTISYYYDLNPTGITCGKGLGRLCRVVDNSGVNDFVYNVLGQLTNKTSIIGTTTIPWLISYDLNSRPSIIATGNRYIMHERDADQRLLKVFTSIGGSEQYLLNNATYQADGNIKTLSYGNGETVTHTYDLSGHRLRTTRVGVGINDTFTWSTNGWLQKRVTNGIGGSTRTYTYDSLGRLVSESGTPLTQSFGYDDNGNRLSNGSNTYAYTANTNAMSKRQASVVTRDAAGNTLTDGTGRTLTWDNWGNLSSVTKAGITTSYVYNYRHQRVKKSLSNGTVTLYHYDESDRLIMETSGTGTVQAMYFYLDDNTPFALMYAANSPNNNTAQDQIIYLHTDHLGTSRLATDSTKKLIWRWESDAFGSTLANQDPDADGKATVINLRFPGQYYDAESGLHYNWNRYYDPASGRYISRSFSDVKDKLNTYIYQNNNPTSESVKLGKVSNIYYDKKGSVTGFNGKSDVHTQGFGGFVWEIITGARKTRRGEQLEDFAKDNLVGAEPTATPVSPETANALIPPLMDMIPGSIPGSGEAAGSRAVDNTYRLRGRLECDMKKYGL